MTVTLMKPITIPKPKDLPPDLRIEAHDYPNGGIQSVGLINKAGNFVYLIQASAFTELRILAPEEDA